MVTHLVEEALELADRIAVLTKRPGTIKRSTEFFALEDKINQVIKP